MWHWELLTKLAKGQRIVLHSSAGVTFVMVWSVVDLNVPQASHGVLMALTLALMRRGSQHQSENAIVTL